MTLAAEAGEIAWSCAGRADQRAENDDREDTHVATALRRERVGL